jgi:hypothetical protein
VSADCFALVFYIVSLNITTETQQWQLAETQHRHLAKTQQCRLTKTQLYHQAETQQCHLTETQHYYQAETQHAIGLTVSNPSG